MTWSELGEVERAPASSAQLRTQARIHRQKMVAIPMACVVFALLALPLAFTNRRGGKSSGFALSIGIVVFYYVLLSQGEKAALADKLPPMIALWIPNLLFGTLGILMISARDRDRALVPLAWSRSAFLGRLRAALGDAIGAALAAIGLPTHAGSGGSAPGRARVVVRLPRLRCAFRT
jgi:hypothetical protein